MPYLRFKAYPEFNAFFSPRFDAHRFRDIEGNFQRRSSEQHLLHGIRNGFQAEIVLFQTRVENY